MLEQILTRTPIWVWPLLAFLIYRGLAASVEREVPLWSLFILPLVMLGLSLQDVLSKFGTPAALSLWLAGLALGAATAWRLFTGALPYPARRTILLRGSWAPLALMMAIFCTKYAVGVALSLQPALRQHAVFVAAVCALYGLFSGVFLGQLLRVLVIYRGEVGRNYKLM